MKNEGWSLISVWILARLPVAGAVCFRLFITHQKLLNALKSPKSKKILQESTNRASERVLFSTLYLQLDLAHVRNSRVKKTFGNLCCTSEGLRANGRNFSFETLYGGQFRSRLLSTLRSRIIDFSLIWLNWIQTLNLTFPLEHFLKSSEAPKLLKKTYFKSY